jgi:hypothetical protein
MGLFNRLFGEPEREMTQHEIVAEIQAEAIDKVKEAIDVINDNMDFLPRGMRPWMRWGGSPRLLLTQHDFGAREVIHGEED